MSKRLVFFTDEDHGKIRDALSITASGKKRNISTKEQIEAFISELDFYCIGKNYLLKQPKKVDIRAIRERILTDCKAALKHLKQIERGKKITWYADTLEPFGVGSETLYPTEVYLEHSLASDAVGPLEKFIKLVEGYHEREYKRIGRKKADSDHFIRRIRDVYIEHIGKNPTTHRGGPFYDVVRAVLEILHRHDQGLSYEDPSRGIKAALKTR